MYLHLANRKKEQSRKTSTAELEDHPLRCEISDHSVDVRSCPTAMSKEREEIQAKKTA